jgi:hypothetical protein
VLFNHLLHLDDQLPILGKPLLPRGKMVKQGLGSVVRMPNPGIIAIERVPILEIPLNDPPIKRPGMPKQIINIGLLVLPQLGRGMLADGVDEAVGVEHRHPFVYGRL